MYIYIYIKKLKYYNLCNYNVNTDVLYIYKIQV